MSNMFTIKLPALLLSLLNVLILLKIYLDSGTLLGPVNVEILDVHRLKFESYLQQFNKSYNANEYNLRLRNFKASLKDILRLNAIEDHAVFGLTHLSDWSPEEIGRVRSNLEGDKYCVLQNKTKCLKKNVQDTHVTYKDRLKCTDNSSDIPLQCDWRKRGVVGAIRNQKECLGCWAFSIVGVMESMAAIQGVSHNTLSIQELLDCSAPNNGCLGGNVNSALNYLCTFGLGIVNEDQYPLTLRNGDGCKKDLPSNGLRVKEFYNLCNASSTDILRLVAHHGPVTTIVNYGPLINYLGGIVRRACTRGWDSIDHVVQIVGFDLTGSIPYYIVRNSYGVLAGDHGYINIAIEGNVCGIRDDVAAINVT
ncbi:cathepsin O-like [Anticarsia gemmatalis]|uniref:cathepsin O-like n=1 Tax=Anticarsia gemmatalis TaxID=129554 RepID=UPI003F76838D